MVMRNENHDDDNVGKNDDEMDDCIDDCDDDNANIDGD